MTAEWNPSAEERLKLLIDHAVEYAMLVIAPDGRILEWKAGAERIMGWTEAEAVGQPFSLIFNPEDQAAGAWQDELRRAARDGRADDKRWHMKKDGSRFFANGVLTPLRSPEGELLGFGKVLRDETDRKRSEQALKQSEEWLRTVTDSVPVLIAFLDRDLRFRFANGAYREWFDIPPEEILGRSLRQVLGDTIFEQRRTHIETALSGQAVRFEGPTRHHQAGIRDTEIVYTPHAEGGEVRGFFVLVRDITEQKGVERALREQERKKDEFLAMLAHELRNPLAPIRSAAEILHLRATEDPSLDKVRDIIARQVGHMSRLVDDLLDVSRISRGKITLRKAVLDLADALPQAAHALAPLAAQRGIDLTVTTPAGSVLVDADLTRVEQMVGNALSNALKFTPSGGKVTVTAAREGSWVVVRVRDTGVGVSPELQESVFELFAQTERSLDRREGGLGIGLTVLRALAELHGGGAELHSEGEGKGTELVIRFPALPPSVRVSHRDREEEHLPSTPRRVLVIDDNVDGAESLADLLRAHGHEVACAYDGLSALESVRMRPPEVAVCDIGLPKLNGYEVVKRLRGELGVRDCLCIAVTGYGEERDRKQAVDAGFDHHLTKPANPSDILRLIATLEGPRTADQAG
jgi:PAS domain S-box-containing protein